MSTGASDAALTHRDDLDGWRGVAILFVLAGHFFHVAGQRLGVEIFFVLSGLLMSRILFDTDITIATFYQRRIARIVPVFLLFLATVCIGTAALAPSFPFGQIGYSLLLVQSYMPATTPTLPLPIGHLWSLNVEEHSYIFLSLIAICTRRHGTACIALAIAATGCVAMYAVYAHIGVDGMWRSECAAFPLLSSAALHLGLRDAKPPAALFAVAVLAAFGSMMLSRALGGSTFLDYIAKPFSLALVVNTLQTAPKVVHALLTMRWLRWFGITSFSLYLWQQPFYQWVSEHRLPPWTGFAAAVAVGALSFHGFETPMRRAIRSFHAGASFKRAPFEPMVRDAD